MGVAVLERPRTRQQKGGKRVVYDCLLGQSQAREVKYKYDTYLHVQQQLRGRRTLTVLWHWSYQAVEIGCLEYPSTIHYH